jgi:RimJ/RimL family protein N-acetyltransferase
MGSAAVTDAGRRVRLRPMTSDDLGLLELWRSPAYLGRFNDFGTSRQPAREVEREHSGKEQGGTLIVELVGGGTPIGTVSWRAATYGPTPESLAWNIGINLIPDARGHGYGVEAQVLLAAHLFTTTKVNRIEAMTDVENLAEQRALEKAGFTREGVLAGAQFRASAMHDLVVYGLVRGSSKPGG